MGNPIGELQEFTQKKLMKPPIYEFSNEQGPPHAREFVCTIKLGKYVEKGQYSFMQTYFRCCKQNLPITHNISPLHFSFFCSYHHHCQSFICASFRNLGIVYL